jgi:hypothetical protein
MKENEKILGEAFFKKQETYAEKMKKKLPQYEPLDKKELGTPGFGSIMDITKSQPFGVVKDTEEAAKRLQGFFGATVGVNSVRNMAARSIKSFPIVISENVEPETAVMLKKLMEEQYAEYINLLISNKVVDVGAFETVGKDKDVNIANQVLDIISSAETERQAVSRKAMSGKLTTDDFLSSTPIYNLIRQESVDTGNVLIDTLFENAIVTTPENKDTVVKFLQEDMDHIVSLKEADDETEDRTPTTRESRYTTVADYIKNDVFIDNRVQQRILNRDAAMNTLTGYTGATTSSGNPIFNKLSTPSLVVDQRQMREVMDRSIGELLMDQRNFAIRDRFEKATFLLYGNRISGGEYVEYLMKRLGLPIGQRIRADIVTDFPSHNVRDLENSNFTINLQDMSRIQNNLTLQPVERSIPRAVIDHIFSFNGNHYAAAMAYGAASGGLIAGVSGVASGVTRWFSNLFLGMGNALSQVPIVGQALALLPTGLGAALGAISTATATLFTASPIGWAILGAAGIGAGIVALRQWHLAVTANRRRNRDRISGWERVEALIVAMEAQQREVRRSLEPQETPQVAIAGQPENEQLRPATAEEINSTFDDFNSRLNRVWERANRNSSTLLSDSAKPVYIPLDGFDFSADSIQHLEENLKIFEEAVSSDKEYQALVMSESVLQEKVVSQTFPVKLVKKYEYDTKARPDVMVVPEFSSRSRYAYGSVEYERKELKDRKYNTPLIMTVRFRERLADDKFSDNELVAVIGILGVITYVPSEEMEYILKSNIEGKTIKGILAADPAVGALASDLLGALDIKKMEEKISSLPKSGEFWQNLEKVAKLSAVNKLAGRQSNNVANAHIVFSQKEIDNVKANEGVDYLRDEKLAAALMKRYGAFTLMIANDVTQRVYLFDDLDNISWNVVPYSAFKSKDAGDNLEAALMKIGRKI